MESTNLEKNNNNPKFNTADVYDDHFDQDIDSKDRSQLLSTSNKAGESDDGDVITSKSKRSASPVYVSQQQISHLRREQTCDKPSDTDSEPETDVYNFTEDQQRAMMELLAQKQEDADLLDEEPPEYNVKGRIEQLNAELANDPTPVERDREHRVGFKTEIVDLVAPPPPDYSDDESQTNSNRGEVQTSVSIANQMTSSNNINKDSNKELVNDPDKRQFVVERDGQFSLLSSSELSSSERAIFINEDSREKKIEKQREIFSEREREKQSEIVQEKKTEKQSEIFQEKKTEKQSEIFQEKKTEKQSENEKIKNKALSSRSHSAGTSGSTAASQVLPRPPARPRPNTTTSGPRRNVYVPLSAGQPINSNSILEHFNYSSPYAMTSEQKMEAREKARKFEEERKEKERKNKEEEEERRRENDSAFQAWLRKKREEDKKRQGAEGEKQKTEQERKEENEEAYKAWLKEKKTQVKKEKLLKRRQQQEKVEGSFLRSPEECEEAFKEWLKRKNAASKKQNSNEKQANRLYRIHVVRSRKIQALIKALKELHTSRYLESHG